MTNNTFWKAVVEQNAAFDFQFYYGVSTTKIVCFPSCKAKTPLRKNVVYFDDMASAYSNGYRACKRCRPHMRIKPSTDESQKKDLGLTTLLDICHKIEKHCEGPLTAQQLASSTDLSQFQLQRLFKKYLGVTPKHYIDQVQLTTLKVNLRASTSVTEAIYDSGIESTSVIYGRMNRHLGMTPKQYRDGGKGEQIAYAIGTTNLGLVLIAATNKGLSFLQFGDCEHQLLALLVSEFPRAKIEMMCVENKPQLSKWLTLLNLYIEGSVIDFDIPLDIKGTVFQKKVWDFLRRIPYGQVMSYGEIAKSIGSPNAFRAVANACASNNVALVIPCHRVIRGDGSLGGYRWGEKRKRVMLNLEKKVNITP